MEEKNMKRQYNEAPRIEIVETCFTEDVLTTSVFGSDNVKGWDNTWFSEGGDL